jgi:uncharacterized membrane protein
MIEMIDHHIESRRVHLSKALTWRLVASATTVLTAYLMLGDVRIGMAIGGVDAVAKLGLYYGHERAWGSVLARRRLA